MRSIAVKALVATAAVFLVSGCGLKYTVKDPVVSGIRYDNRQAKQMVLKIVDQRTNREYQEKLGGLSGVSIKLENIEENPVAWLSRSLEKEFEARAMPVKIANGNAPGAADIVLTVKRFQIANRRMTGWSPWESYHTFRGEVAFGSKTSDVRAFFFNGKVPKWSMGEIEDPCINMPLSLLVKEIASKVNKVTVRGVANDSEINNVNVRADKLAKQRDDDACYPLYELGGSNNPAAMKALLVFADNDDRFIRSCALSAIGILDAQGQMEFLKKKFAQYEEIDKYMALKSIGDIRTAQAIDFVSKAKNDPLYNNEFAFKYVVDLFLEK